jgi:hypothetical protein
LQRARRQHYTLYIGVCVDTVEQHSNQLAAAIFGRPTVSDPVGELDENPFGTERDPFVAEPKYDSLYRGW